MFIFKLLFISVSISAFRSVEADRSDQDPDDISLENYTAIERHKNEEAEADAVNALALFSGPDTNSTDYADYELLQESARFSIAPDFYASMFGNSIASIQSSTYLFTNASTFVAAPVVLGVSLLAALGAGIAALIAIVLVPLRIANQILAIIALALLIAYIIEEIYIHKHFHGDAEVYGEHYVEPSYSSMYKREGEDDPLSWKNEIETSESWAAHTTELPNSIVTTGQTTKLDEAARNVRTALNKYYHLNQYKAVHNQNFEASEPDRYFASMFSTE